MPSVGMRRTTRVFGVVKGVDGARVLRSGRRILPDSGESKLRRTHEVANWNWDSLLKDHNKGKGHKTSGGGCGGGGDHRIRSKPNMSTRKRKEEVFRGQGDKQANLHVKKGRKVKTQSTEDEKHVDKMFGIVYGRKRKRLDDQKGDCTNSRQSRISKDVLVYRPMLIVVVDSSFSGNCWFWSVFNLVLRYMRKAKLKLSALLAFFLSHPINGVYADHGVRFLLEPNVNRKGICKFFGSRKCQPLFSLDFSAAPHRFMHMHYTMFCRMMVQSSVFVNKYLSLLEHGETQPMEESNSDNEILVFEATNSRSSSKLQLHPSVRASKLTGRNGEGRNGLSSHSFQKRRSSHRRKRSRSISLGVHKNCNQALVFNQIGSKKKVTPFSSVVATRKLRSSPRSNSTSNSNGMNSPKKDLDSLSCSANILVFDSDRCSREEGFSIMLELSSSKEWFLVIKREGSTRYRLKAQKVMRPYSCNRFTHAIIWIGDDNWKLEFCNRQDWLVFKDLYKECSDRNVSTPNLKVIPVPGVQEVLGFENYSIGDYPSFCRPVSYISVKDDEVSRAMARNTGIYDIDSEDEEWLKKINGKFSVENEKIEKLSPDNFELMIDGFEKSYFCSPDDYTNEKAASSLSHLGEKEVVKTVYSYWINKRKQNKAPLIRVFQARQVKKTLPVSKPVFRKRRSFKRQGSQLLGRGNQLTRLQEKVAKQGEASEEQKALLRIKEAEASALRSMEVAVKRRQRAQVLMEIADLATYKAWMALRISEVAKAAKSSDSAAIHFLD